MFTRHLTAIAIIALPLAAKAQGDPAALAKALGMTEAQFMACLPADMTPGQRLPRAQREAVFKCFKTANPDLSPQSIRAAMQDLNAGG